MCRDKFLLSVSAASPRRRSTFGRPYRATYQGLEPYACGCIGVNDLGIVNVIEGENTRRLIQPSVLNHGRSFHAVSCRSAIAIFPREPLGSTSEPVDRSSTSARARPDGSATPSFSAALSELLRAAPLFESRAAVPSRDRCKGNV